ncbi:MAG TPA: carboxylesterase/lipase family protein [Candidatus Lokiarchaeia archaeon]|nr:carboxylesterase/lipase family protein [Candidatus Lokiarchaeia archaeon]
MEQTGIIETRSGKIRGYVENGLNIFKGIPFAEPPTSELRFKPPVSKTWEEVLETSALSSCACQATTDLEKIIPRSGPESEDCLYLNIWTPATDEGNRPVMFWIHGGAFVIQSGNDPTYDGATLARRGDVIVVTINYRLGFLGFPYVSGKIANLGSLDQIMALEWVRDNINLFGGDPGNVTIFGESAGGYSVIALCSMPAAKGLFRRVIAESTPSIDPTATEETTMKIFRRLGVKGTNFEDLVKTPVQDIMDAQNKVFASNPTNLMALRPVIDHDTWPKHPLKAFQDGDCDEIDLMMGTNKDEAKLFTNLVSLNPLLRFLVKHMIRFVMKRLFAPMGIKPEKSQEIVTTYMEARAGKISIEGKDLMDAILTDSGFRIPTIRLLEAQSVHQSNTYAYLFSWSSPEKDGAFGSCHALEVPFVFGNLDSPTAQKLCRKTPETQAISEKMMDAWISFARTGSPGWPGYDVENRATMVFGEQCEVVNAPFDKERAVWNGLLEI